MSNSNKEPFFSKEKQDKALQWLSEKWGNRTCECCGQNNWNIADMLVAPPTFEGGMTLGGKTMPQVVVTCTNCGNTKHFNAVIMGVVG